MHKWITIELVTHVVLTETMCSDLDLGLYLKGQGQTRHFYLRVHMRISGLSLTYAMMDYHVTWYNCCAHWEDVQWLGHTRHLNCQSTHACVRAITYLWIEASVGDIAVFWTALAYLWYKLHLLIAYCTNHYFICYYTAFGDTCTSFHWKK